MKTAWVSLLTIMLLGLSACSTTKNNIERTAEQEKIATMIQSGNFVYNAKNANPLRVDVLDILPAGAGQQLRQLSPGYFVSVTKDSLRVHLPFYGRSHQAEMDLTKSGINFETTNFKYSYETTRKGYYIATIDVNGQNSASKLTLNISQSGYATLQVQSTHRDPMSFYGQIDAQKSDILNGN